MQASSWFPHRGRAFVREANQSWLRAGQWFPLVDVGSMLLDVVPAPALARGRAAQVG
jgi:hypothetical protein